MHVEPLEKVGNIQIRNGAIMASPDEFYIKIKGVGGHGSMPHRCVDPIAISAEIVNEFQKIARESLSPFTPCTVSVCSVHSGTCPNVIPSEAYMEGTVRAFDENIRRLMSELLEKKAKDICAASGAECEFKFVFLYPPVINDPKMNETLKAAAKKVDSINDVIILENPAMAGDDFSYFAKAVPSAYFKLGVGNDTINNPIHSPYFDVDVRAFATGSELMAKIAVEYLTENEMMKCL